MCLDERSQSSEPYQESFNSEKKKSRYLLRHHNTLIKRRARRSESASVLSISRREDALMLVKLPGLR